MSLSLSVVYSSIKKKQKDFLSISRFRFVFFIMSDDNHKKIYKNQGIDADELHKRRMDRNVVLRKQKQEEQVEKQTKLFFPHVQFLAFETTKFSCDRRTRSNTPSIEWCCFCFGISSKYIRFGNSYSISRIGHQ